MSAERALLGAIRAALLADADVSALLAERVYDDAPADAVFPYVTFGRIETRAADASASAALDHAVTLHVWSRHGGRAEALSVIAAMRAALHHAALTPADHRLILLLVSFTDVFRAGDGRTTHGVVRLRAVTEAE